MSPYIHNITLVYDNTIDVNTNILIYKKYAIAYILIFQIKYNINIFRIHPKDIMTIYTLVIIGNTQCSWHYRFGKYLIIYIIYYSNIGAEDLFRYTYQLLFKQNETRRRESITLREAEDLLFKSSYNEINSMYDSNDSNMHKQYSK